MTFKEFMYRYVLIRQAEIINKLGAANLRDLKLDHLVKEASTIYLKLSILDSAKKLTKDDGSMNIDSHFYNEI